MLGLSSGLVFNNYPIEIIPTDISDLVGWWDFTDASSMYTDAGSTNVSSSGDVIARVDNKAYTNNNSPLMLGKFAVKSDVGGSDYANGYTTGGANGKSYVSLGSTAGFVSGWATSHGGIPHDYVYSNMSADQIQGVSEADMNTRISNFDSNYDNVLSTSILDPENITIFTVAKPPNVEFVAGDWFHSSSQTWKSVIRISGKTSSNGTLSLHSVGAGNGSSNPDYWNAEFGRTNVSASYGTGQKVIAYGSGNERNTFTDPSPDSPEVTSGAQIITAIGGGSGSSKLYKNGNTSDGKVDGDSGSTKLHLGHIGGAAGSHDSHKFDKIEIGARFNASSGGNHGALSSGASWNWGDTDDLEDDQSNGIYEIIIYSKKLSSEEISGIETYLKTKYGIS